MSESDFYHFEIEIFPNESIETIDVSLPPSSLLAQKQVVPNLLLP